MHRKRPALLPLAMALVLATGILTTTEAAASGSWSPVKVLSPPGDLAGGPQVIVDRFGNTTAVFNNQFQTNNVITHELRAVYRPAGGTWQPAQTISDPALDLQGPIQLATDAKGDVTAAWVAYDPNDQSDNIVVADKPLDGSWTSPVVAYTGGPPPLNQSAPQLSNVRIAVDDAGDLTALWLVDHGYGTPGIVQTAARPAGGSWSDAVDLTTNNGSSAGPVLAADPSGNLVAMWSFTANNAKPVIQSATQPAGGAWEPTSTLTDSTVSSIGPRVEVVSDGHFVAAWGEAKTSSAHYIRAAYYDVGGSWGSGKYVSDAGTVAGSQQIAVDGSGNVTIVWLWSDQPVNNQVYSVQASTRKAGRKAWSWPASWLSPKGTPTWYPQIVSNPKGDLTAVWAQQDASGWVTKAARRPAGSAWQKPVTISDPRQGLGLNQLASDPYGDVATVWQARVDNSTVQVEESHLDTAGPTSSTVNPNRWFQKHLRFRVAWRAHDLWSAIASHDVRVKSAPWDGGFGSFTKWRNAVTGSHAAYRGRPGQTYCFDSRATDSVGNVGAWSHVACSTTPVDDSSAAASAGWSTVTDKGYYLGTESTTSKRRATLTLTGVRAKRLGLLVSTGPSDGKVEVLFGGVSLGTFSLASTDNHNKVLIPVATFGKARKGELELKVLTHGKPVRIDGIYVGR